MFTPQQIKIIELFGEGQAVVAGAGCGKTTTLVAKCLELMKRSPEARFCAVSFTEKSVRDLKTSLAEGFAKENAIFDPRSHWVKTIHGLCATIIQDFPLQAGLQGGETVLQEDQANQLWERSVTLLWSQNESAEISESVDQLLQLYSRSTLETLLKKLRSLMSFGVDDFIHRSFDRAEVKNLWLVFESVYLRYQHAKKRQGHLDFNDLEIYAVEALKSEVVCRYYQNRFNLVLVDEFQDTNPLQGKILERFVKPDLSNLCIVGDPKQSIYRFRDADVSVFNDLIQKLPSKHLLDTNYRSRPGVIQFVNEVCAPVFEASDLSYEPLQAGRESDESISVSRLILENDDTLAQFLKSQQAAGVDLSEYVILMRSLRNARGQSHLKSLDRHQVPFILGSGGRFYSDPRVQELVALLKGFSSSKNTLSQVNALRAPWIQVPDATLIGWKDHYYEKFFGSSHPVAKALAPLFNSTVSIRPGQILETLMSVDSLDEEMSMPLVTLWHKAEALSSQARRFDEVVDYFTDAIDHEKIEKEVPPPVKSGTVRVMTIHGSKGLQFPRVILTDFEGPSKSSTRTGDLIWDRKKGVHLFLRDEEGKKTDDKVNDEWSELEKRAMVAEGKRVFYVAVTRPQEELILAWKKEVKTKEGIEPFAIDNWRAWIEATVLPPEKKWTPAANLSETLNAFSNDGKSADPVFSAPPHPELRSPKNLPDLFRPRHSPSEWLVLNQCEFRYQKKFLQVELEEEVQTTRDFIAEPADAGFAKQNAEAILDAETVAEKGERVHLMLETENWDGLAAEYANSDTGAKVVEQVRDYFFSLNDGFTYRELGFEIPLSSNEALAGQMDRLEINSVREELRLIDFKWTAKPKSGAALLENYLLQLQLYLWAAQKLLPFRPQKIAAQLMHFTEAGVHIVDAPSEAFEFKSLDGLAKKMHARSRVVLKLHQEGKNADVSTGVHCNYCECRARCPAWQ